MHDPHHLLGLHPVDEKSKVIRLFRPEAEKIHLEVFGSIVEAKKVKEEGVFEYQVPAHTTLHDYQVYHHSGLLAYDPYAFWPTFGEVDAHLFAKGVHYKLYESLGAKILVHQGVAGTRFAVWAPSAKRVSLVGDFNHWDGRVNPMRSMGACGIWELFVPGVQEGEKYKFEICTQEGRVKLKSDPFAFMSELRPKTASIVCDVNRHEWKDESWMRARAEKKGVAAPLNIYEVHLGSWKRSSGNFLNYRQIAHELAAYCKEMGFSHVELMPIAEHPLDESWGYQVTGFFAPTSRYGTPSDFQYFVDYMHQQEIGVIVDWVPAHFPSDDHALANFDGTCLFEHVDPKQGFHPHWNTSIFNYGRVEVSNFLLVSALFWFDKMHIDGVRVDAVASMLYLDYGRSEGEWVPNIYGGRDNLEAIEFMKHLNSIVHERHPGALVFAEESTSFGGVTHPVEWGGLGFDIKWNMGWMNDTLRYFHKDPIFRPYHHNELSFGLLYAFSEQFLLVLSHDEVVHGKGSLLAKMPGDDWQKFANVRLLYSYMICHPGKKLLFMGGEIGQWNEWNCKEELHWFLLRYDRHKSLQLCVKELNHLYHARPALWEFDYDGRGFEWIDFSDRRNSVLSYIRKGTSSYLVCVHNFSPNYFPEYLVRLQNVKEVQEIFNTDREEYGGSGKINAHVAIVKDEAGAPKALTIQLAPLATMIFEVRFV
ncbi:MAG: 1,4-alpha-glucan branching protein GlgB [Chlamydiales bacterium]|nr:1,4-alpha-glucan branching protein GlgB [Chlamydiales bacterium]